MAACAAESLPAAGSETIPGDRISRNAEDGPGMRDSAGVTDEVDAPKGKPAGMRTGGACKPRLRDVEAAPARAAAVLLARPPPEADPDDLPGEPDEGPDDAAGAFERTDRRAGAVAAAAESDALAPAAPDEPESANAIGIDATAEPTPNATANAPTRPT